MENYKEFINPKPFDCFMGTTTQECVCEFWKEYETQNNPSLISTILKEMQSDTEDESNKLLLLYMISDEKERAMLDYMLVVLCGWSMKTLIEKNRASRVELTQD